MRKILLSILLFCILPWYSGAEEADSVPRVLVINSGDSGGFWTREIGYGFRTYFSDRSRPVRIDTIELSILRNPGLVPRRQDVEWLLNTLASRPFDLVVTVGDAAGELIFEHYDKLPRSVPFLFSSVSGFDPERRKNYPNATGLEQPSLLLPNLELGRRLFPAADTVAVITDGTLTGENRLRQFRQETAGYRGCRLLFLHGGELSTPELLERLSQLPENSFVLLSGWSSTRPEPSLPFKELYEKIADAAQRPILVFRDAMPDSGTIGGVMVRARELGAETARLAERLLGGESADSIPIRPLPAFPWFYSARLPSVAISGRRLPEGSRFLDAPPSFREKYGAAATAAAATAFLLLSFFGAVHFRRTRRLEAIFSRLPLRVTVADGNGRILFRRAAGPYASPGRQIHHLDELPTEEAVLFREAILQVLSEGNSVTREFLSGGRRRRAEFVPLPRKFFGVESVLWASVDIEELHAARHSAEQLSERFKLTLDSIADGVIATDSDGMITLTNPVAARLTGYSEEELRGREHSGVVRLVDAVNEIPLPSPLVQAIRSNRAVALSEDAVLAASDGVRRHIAAEAAPIRSRAGAVSGAVLVFHDISSDYEARRKISMQNEQLKMAAEVAGIACFRCSIQGRPLERFQNPKFWGYAPDGRTMTPEEWIAAEDRPEFFAVWNRLFSGQSESEQCNYRAGSGSGKNLFYELTIRRLQHSTEFGEPEFFGVIRNVTATRLAEQQRLDTTVLLQTLLDNLPCYIYVKDPETSRNTLCNKAFSQLLGRPAEEIIGKRNLELFPPAEVESIEEGERRAVESGALFETDATFTDVDGVSRRGHFFFKPLSRASGKNLLLGMVLDTTDEERREQQLKELNLMLQDILDNLPCLLFVKDYSHGNRYLLGNPLFHRELGLEPGSMIGKNDRELFPPDTAEKYISDDDRLMQGRTGEPIEVLESCPTVAGIRTVHTRKLRLARPGGDLLLGISIDVTERENDRRKLEEANNLLGAITDNLPCMLFVKDADDDFRYLLYNRVFCDMFGLNGRTVIGRNDFDLLAPEIAPLCRESDRAAAAAAEASFNVEEVQLSDGKIHALHNIKKLITGPAGRRLLLGISVDITAEKQLTEEGQRMIRELQEYSALQQAVGSCLESVMLEDDEDDAIRLVLRAVCEYLKADRCYTLQYDYDNNEMAPAQEYVPNGREWIVNLPRLPFTEQEPWLEILNSRRILSLSDARSAESRRILGSWEPYTMEHSIHSLHLIGICFNEGLWGNIGVVYEEEKHEFSEHDRELLRSAAHIIEIVLLRKQSRAQLERSEYEKRLILDTIRIPVLLFDAGMNLIRANNAALAIPGISEAEALSTPCYRNFCGFEKRPEICPVQQTVRDGKPHMVELRIKGRDYVINSYPIMIGGKLVYILKSLIDMTDANESRHRLGRALLEAQNANKAKSFFLATMSHELRTPLNAVIGFSELLRSNELSRKEQNEYLDSINLAGNALLNLINDVLDLSRLEAEQLAIVPHPADIAVLARELQAVFRQKAAEKQLELTFSAPENLPEVFVDCLRLRQILFNLIGNAIKFTERGSVSIGVEFTPGEKRYGTLRIRVRDTGIGIPPESRELIFQPFVQPNTVRDSRNGQGTGLGLAISSRLAACMGGRIVLESEVDCGSTFTVELERVEFISAANSPERSATETLPAAVASGTRVLLVDDVPMNLKVLSAMLRKFNFSIRSAGSGREALARLQEESVDFVLTDMWMPEMNGSELAAAIRADAGLSSVRLIAVTADTANADNFPMGYFDAVLLKPVSQEKLIALFARLSAETAP